MLIVNLIQILLIKKKKIIFHYRIKLSTLFIALICFVWRLKGKLGLLGFRLSPQWAIDLEVQDFLGQTSQYTRATYAISITSPISLRTKKRKLCLHFFQYLILQPLSLSLSLSLSLRRRTTSQFITVTAQSLSLRFSASTMSTVMQKIKDIEDEVFIYFLQLTHFLVFTFCELKPQQRLVLVLFGYGEIRGNIGKKGKRKIEFIYLFDGYSQFRFQLYI